MMDLLPGVGWAEVATKRDLDGLAERVEMKVDRLDIKIDTVAERLDAKIDFLVGGLDAKHDFLVGGLDAKIDNVAGQMATKADLHELKSDLQRTFVTWILTAQATVIAAVALLFSALR